MKSELKAIKRNSQSLRNTRKTVEVVPETGITIATVIAIDTAEAITTDMIEIITIMATIEEIITVDTIITTTMVQEIIEMTLREMRGAEIIDGEITTEIDTKAARKKRRLERVGDL